VIAASPDARRVAFIGLGNMGAPMARHLRNAGHQVSGYDPSESARARAAAAGVEVLNHLADIPGRFDVVMLMLPNSGVVEEVLVGDDGLLDRLTPDSVVVDMGSSKPASTKALAAIAENIGVGYVDAPVSGGVVGAETGTLTIMVGGREKDIDRVRELLDVLGGNISHLGPPGAGHALKALNNLMSATHLLISSEALLAGQRFGLDVQVMLDAVNTSSGRSGSTEVKWPRYIVPESYDSGFGLSLMLKDMRIAVELASECGLPSQLGQVAVELWSRADQALGPGADHTRIASWLANRPVSSPEPDRQPK